MSKGPEPHDEDPKEYELVLSWLGAKYTPIPRARELANVVSRLVNDGGGAVEIVTTNYDEMLERALQQTDGLTKGDWRTDWARSLAILAAALYLTCSLSAAKIFGPDVVDELRDNAIAAIAIYGGLREWNRRKGR